jgi:hypothetical protein
MSPFLYIDIDVPPFNLEEIWVRFRIIPTVIVKTSARGLHLYWVLKKPINSIPDLISTISIQFGLVELLQGDYHLLDPSGFSRLPGTFNTKYKDPYLVNFENTNVEYDLKYFDFLKTNSFLKIYFICRLREFIGPISGFWNRR